MFWATNLKIYCKKLFAMSAIILYLFVLLVTASAYPASTGGDIDTGSNKHFKDIIATSNELQKTNLETAMLMEFIAHWMLNAAIKNGKH